MKHTWITMDTDTGEDTPYLVKHDRDGEHYGWQLASVAGVADILGDQAWAEADGEESDRISVWTMTAYGIVPVKVEQTACPGMGMVCVELSHRDPSKRGKAAWMTVKAFYRTREA